MGRATGIIAFGLAVLGLAGVGLALWREDRVGQTPAIAPQPEAGLAEPPPPGPPVPMPPMTRLQPPPGPALPPAPEAGEAPVHPGPPPDVAALPPLPEPPPPLEGRFTLPPYSPPAPAGPPMSLPDISLEPVAFAALEGWAEDDHASAFTAFHRSCRAVVERILPSRAAMPVGEALAAICREVAAMPAVIDRFSARQFFETRFRAVRIARLGEATGMITGYYEPVVEGSLERTEDFTVPLHRKPDDLVQVDGRWGRMVEGRVRPYLDRAEIEDGALAGKGLEIAWIRDPIDAFFIHIQGSTRVKLPDGRVLRLNYDGQNGHPYVAVGRALIDRGIVPREEMSLDRIRQWMNANPAEGRELRRTNKSYIFFRDAELQHDEEALGAQGIPLTAWRSIAVDRNLHIYGTPFFIEADLPIEGPEPTTRFRRLMIAQDTGGAILGPARADIYTGTGEDAGRIAGRFRHQGRFVMLIPAALDPVTAGAGVPWPLTRGGAPIAPELAPPPPPPGREPRG